MISSRLVRVALLDDHAVVRAGYRRLIELEDDMEVAAEFASAEQALDALAREGAALPDVLVLDLSLPGIGGLELMERLARRLPTLRILVFSMHEGPATIRQCMRAGAAGFISKSSPPAVLIDAIRRVVRGDIVLSEGLNCTIGEVGGIRCDELSLREFAILQRLIEGRSVESIAAVMHLSYKTVANYQTAIRHKLGVRNAVELIEYARRNRIGAG